MTSRPSDPSDNAREKHIQDLIKSGVEPDVAVQQAYEAQREAKKGGGAKLRIPKAKI